MTPQRENRRQRFPRPRAGAPRAGDAAPAAATTGPHRPIMLREVLRCLQPMPGDLVVDATLGGGGHASAVLERIQPGGWLIGLDVDSSELPKTEARLRAAGFGPDTLTTQHASFAELPRVLAAEAGAGAAADLILVDLGVSSMQLENPARGFHYKGVGPLDLRMDPARGENAAQLLARLPEGAIADLLTAYADEPHARVIAGLLKRATVASTHGLERTVRLGLTAARPNLTSAEVKMSVRRTLQALRIAVNDELAALDRLLDALPACLAPGGRVVILTFHSGEDRRVKKAFQAGHRAGVYSSVAREVVRSTKEETRANRRAAAAKLRWAVRTGRPGARRPAGPRPLPNG